MKVYQALATALQAERNCQKSGNVEWQAKHWHRIECLVDDLPRGSGFDSGHTLDGKRSTPDRLVLSTEFHHMNEHGMYSGWTQHDVIVTPSLVNEFNLRITGRNRNGIKDYIAEIFSLALLADA